MTPPPDLNCRPSWKKRPGIFDLLTSVAPLGRVSEAFTRSDF
jgi:hypothetical protein